MAHPPEPDRFTAGTIEVNGREVPVMVDAETPLRYPFPTTEQAGQAADRCNKDPRTVRIFDPLLPIIAPEVTIDPDM